MNRISPSKDRQIPNIKFHCIGTHIDPMKKKYFIHNWHLQALNPKSNNCRWALFLTYFDKRGYCCELGFTLCFTFFKSYLIFQKLHRINTEVRLNVGIFDISFLRVKQLEYAIISVAFQQYICRVLLYKISIQSHTVEFENLQKKF